MPVTVNYGNRENITKTQWTDYMYYTNSYCGLGRHPKWHPRWLPQWILSKNPGKIANFTCKTRGIVKYFIAFSRHSFSCIVCTEKRWKTLIFVKKWLDFGPTTTTTTITFICMFICKRYLKTRTKRKGNNNYYDINNR